MRQMFALFRLCGILVAFYPHPSSADRVELVARVGQTAGCAIDGNVYSLANYLGAEAPQIGALGTITFKAQLNGPGMNSAVDGVIFRAVPGQTRTCIAQEGGVDVNGGRAASFAGLLIGEDGKVGYTVALAGPGVTTANSLSYRSFDGVTERELVRSGTAPFNVISELAPDVTDHLSFRSTILSQSGFGYWTGNPAGAPILIARSGTPAPGASPLLFGQTLKRRATESGLYLVYSNLTASGSSTTVGTGIWAGRPGALQLVARTGDVASGAPNGSVFSWVYESRCAPVISSSSIVAYTAAFEGSESGVGVWRQSSAGRELLVMTGQAIEELGPGVIISSLRPSGVDQNLAIADDQIGTVVVVGQLAGPGIHSLNDRLVLRFGVRGREIVARGSQEILSGVSLDNAYLGQGVLVNAAGDVAIRTRLTGVGVTDGDDWAILRTNGALLQLVAREGQSIEASPGRILRSILGATFLYNALGQVALEGRTATDATDTVGDLSILRIDERGGLKVVTSLGAAIDLADGLRINAGVYWISNSRALSESGDLTFAASILSSSIGDQAVFRVAIEPEEEGCFADFNRDGHISNQDIFDFLEAWFARVPEGDVNGTGGVTSQDIFDFLEYWFRGCV